MAYEPARAKSLFLAAAELPPAERAAYLERECAGDAELRSRVEALLQADAPDANKTAAEPDPNRTVDEPQPLALAGAILAGKYQLSEPIGEGGMGSVWLARQSEPVKRKVAIKLIKAGMDSKSVLARFEAERQALAVMDHPNIAKVYDGGIHEGRPFFVMELVKGVPITHYCDAHKLTPKQRLELFVPVCQAIQHAHQKGIIHRDIKPSNVLIALYDDKPVPKVIDFGVAKATGGTLTEHTIETAFGGIVGTPQYMSPEQASLNNLDVDTRSDVYALGVLLYELLAGSPPFSGEELKRKGLMEILRVVREEEPPRPSAKLSTANALPSLSANRGTEPKKLTGLLRNELDWIVMKALEKDRSRRYETANGFAADVNRYLSGEAVLAHPPSAAYRIQKFVRRHQVQFIAASLVMFALVAGVIGTTLGLLRARNEAVQKEQARVEESQQRKRAEEFRDLALDALRATTGKDVELLIGGKKELGANEKAYLEAIAKRWQAFANREGTHEQARAIRGEGHQRVGILWQKLGRRSEAQLDYKQSIIVYKQLAADFPNVSAYRRFLASSHQNLATLLVDLGKRADAEKQYAEGLAIQKQLAADFPDVALYRSDLAGSHNALGILLEGVGKRAEAESQYTQALAIRQMLAADFPAVPDYRIALAESLNNLGALLQNLGKRAEAEKQYARALGIRQKLAADLPAVPELRSALAWSHHSLGAVLFDLGRRADAEAQIVQAMAIRQKLAAEFPALPAYRNDLANSHNNLGNLLFELDNWAEAEPHYVQSLAIRQQLAAEFPDVPAYLKEQAISHNNLGNLLSAIGKRDEAKSQYSQSLAIRHKLAFEFPAVPEYAIDLGGSYCNFGHWLLNGEKSQESLSWYAKAIATLTPVHRAEPRHVTAQQFLRNSYYGRAMAYGNLEKYADAASDWDRAIELSSPEERAAYRLRRAGAQLNAGRVTEAVAEAAELTKLPDWNADEWYDFACIYAVASGKLVDQKTEYADRAMQMLQRAAKVGYKNAAHMKKDTDLDSLREREDFKQLLSELEKQFPPQAERAP